MSFAASRRRALVVDDEAMVRAVFRRWLEREDFAVVEAASVVAAAEALLAPGTFDIVITDHRMPGLTGADLVAWIRPRLPDVAVIVVSAFPDEAMVPRPDGLLDKPVARAAFLEAVRAAIAERSLVEELAGA